MDAEIKALKFLPIDISGINLKNLTIDFQLESDSGDGVHFQLVDTSKVTLGDFDLHFTNSVLNKAAQFAHSVVSWFVNKQLPQISSVIDSEINQLNNMIQ